MPGVHEPFSVRIVLLIIVAAVAGVAIGSRGMAGTTSNLLTEAASP